MFGTDGIRSIFGTPPLTPEGILCLAHALARWALVKFGGPITFVIARDTRSSGLSIQELLTCGLASHNTIIDAGIMPTPGVLSALRQQTIYQVGIMITASHNPAFYNGIKIFTRDGKINTFDETTITEYYEQACANRSMHGRTSVPGLHPPGPDQSSPKQLYINKLQNHFAQLDLSKITIILDCAYGATAPILTHLVPFTNANIILLNTHADGSNINLNCGALAPQILSQQVIETKAHIGFAFDGDGDRLTVVNRHGKVLDGDDILALLATHPRYRDHQTLIGTILSNKGLEVYLKTLGKTLLRAPVGDKNVIDMMTHNQSALGGEPSGHIILYDYLPAADGIATALTLLELLCQTHNWDLTTFTKMPLIHKTISITSRPDLTKSPFSNLIDHYRTMCPLGEIIVRYSGTEPILRVSVADPDATRALHISQELTTHLQKEFIHGR